MYIVQERISFFIIYALIFLYIMYLELLCSFFLYNLYYLALIHSLYFVFFNIRNAF